MKRINWIKVFWSPFKRPKIKWYLGPIAVGVPYFFPRKWRKISKEEAMRLAEIQVAKPYITKPLEYWYNHFLNQTRPTPKKIGFDYVGLGWKTKWNVYDVRFEYAPVLSFVFFKWQIAVTIVSEYPYNYWESWILYELYTNPKATKEERIAECRKLYSNIWLSMKDGVEIETDYYELILKPKYL